MKLTERQAEVVRLVADGLSNRQIALVLGVNEKTVRTHITDALTRLGISQGNVRVRLARWVLFGGLGR